MSTMIIRDRFPQTHGSHDRMERLLDRASTEHPLAIDMYRTDEAVVIVASAPGVDPDEIEIRAVGNTLTIKRETRQEKKVEEKDYARHEFRMGRFSRTLALPRDVDSTKATAEFKHGELTVTVPTREESKPKSIKIKSK